MKYRRILKGICTAGAVALATISEMAVFAADESYHKRAIEFEVFADVHIYGATEQGSYDFANALRNINEAFPDTSAVVNVGDLTQNGTEDQYQAYVDILEQNRGNIPEYMNVLGNHDVRWRPGGWQEVYERYMRFNDNYRTDTSDSVYFDEWIGGYHFIFLNTEWETKDKAYFSDEQLQWLDEKLAESEEDGKPVFVFLHQPLSDTHPGGSGAGAVGVQDHQLKEVLRKYPQSLLFTGHIHAAWASETDYGTMLSVPSFRYSDYTGYHVSVYEDRVQLGLYDYLNSEWVDEDYYVVSTKTEDHPKSKVLEVSFDDGTGSDMSGNGNDGIIEGRPEFVDGVEGKAIHLVNGASVSGRDRTAQQYVC